MKEGKQFLCLAPQMKTQHMSDPACTCEVAGLTTGSKIFTLGKRIVTFLCADTLNNDISCQDLQNEKLTNGIIILHPQMNRFPKHEDFSRVRRESAYNDLFTAFMEKQKTEVWFSTSAEQAITIILPNQITNQHGVTTIPSLKAVDCFCWKGDDWKIVKYSLLYPCGRGF
ncbi:MAG: hypothetical protein HFI92_04470 [Lachnospiraceae bacterium]|nr:hypothetical protein [Lachnospiraceae bacterium]